MSTHLFSVFPVQRPGSFARLTCIALQDGPSNCGEPLLIDTRDELDRRLRGAFAPEQREQIVLAVERGETTQVEITDEQARLIGYIQRVH